MSRTLTFSGGIALVLALMAGFARAGEPQDDHWDRLGRVVDGYAALFWWAYREDDRPSPPVIASDDYPYVTWAGAHYAGRKQGKLSDWDDSLTWEAKTRQADYEGMRIVASAYVEARHCAPHTRHAAEAFLALLKETE